MTTIDFYTHVEDRLAVAARLAVKAVAAHGSVRVVTPDAATTDALDRLLWTTPATGFVPHCRMDSKVASETPIWIDHRPDHAGRRDDRCARSAVVDDARDGVRPALPDG